MKGLIALAAGVVAGYSISRAMEARACGVPLTAVFKLDTKTLLTPVYLIAHPSLQAASVVASGPIIDVQSVPS